MTEPISDQQHAARLQAAARRALNSLAALILDNPDPGIEALGAQYELRQVLHGTNPEIPTLRVWQVESQRASGMWTPWSAATIDGDDARTDYADTVAENGGKRAHRLVCATTTRIVEAQQQPAAEETHIVADDSSDPEEPGWCTFGEGDAPGSGCILPAGHEPPNRHVVTPGDTDD